jgi:hypothetical protein
MIRLKALGAVLLLVEFFLSMPSLVWAAQGVIYKGPDAAGVFAI